MSKPTSFIVEDRLMMSRANASFITVTNVVPHGSKTYGCCACCYAPEICPGCALLPCVRDPKYIVKEMEASKYIYIRENSLEWNAPMKIQKEGDCFGSSCCYFRAKDNVKVMYFDDPAFDQITDKTPTCNDMKTWCCGGEGERIEITAKFCWGCCYRAYPPFICGFPTCCYVLGQLCCVGELCVCVQKADIWVENASDAMRDIKEARDNAKARMQIA